MADKYAPESENASCAWCGEHIQYDHTGVDSLVWRLDDPDATDPYSCYEDNPHVPTFDIVCQRAGASNRTADELAAVFILDVAELIGLYDAAGGFKHDAATVNQRLDVDLAANAEGCGWLDDPDDSQMLADAIQVWEGYLSAAGYAVEWDDGYSIWRVAN